MQLTLTLSETFTSLDTFEAFASRLKAALSGLPVQFSSVPATAPSPHPVPVAVAAATVAQTAPPVDASPATVAAPVSSVPEVASTEAPKSKRGRPSNAEKAAKAEDAPPPAVAVEPTPATEAAPTTGAVLSINELRDKLGALAHEYGTALNVEMPKMLIEYGVTRLSNLEDGKRAAFFEKLETALKSAKAA